MRKVSNPPNPWASTEVEYLDEVPAARLRVLEDHSREILATNDSPDLGFRYSVNPYRGCFHGCSYCYARRTHEYLSLGAGTDFERTIIIKPHAPLLLRRALGKRSWKGELILFSGATDAYQPLEACYRLTRGCLEACRDAANPVGVITKSPLIERDIDVLCELHQVAPVRLTISIPLWDKARAKAVEPYVATPQRRIRTIERLAEAGLDVGVNVAPMIPGLSDEHIPSILAAAKNAGARHAALIFLRLPGSVRQVFEERLYELLPLRADRVMARVKEARAGRTNDPRFGDRMRGQGPYAESVQALFDSTARRLGLDTSTWATGTWASSPSGRLESTARRGQQLSLLPV